ncbi:protein STRICTOSIDINE SYNTHASE-LIKE 10-like [Corylus avellana]|uniref:protein STRICTOSIDINE SYNTHASE-LIKE 10-like n=1 Tax=Corylus avellana TaxID=13451 RepID=UPI00286D0519|nr:protein STRICTOSIDINE SYNTHASE-LIKE 10-like [Corylus avellana]
MKLVFPTSVLFFLVMILIAPALILSHEPITSSTDDGQIKNYIQLELPGVVGPESFGFDCHGKGPYIGVSDGRILKWEGAQLGWKEFAIISAKRNRKVCDGSTNPDLEPTCGRPLGLKFNPATCDLYIADAYFGLLMVGLSGGVAKQLATSAEGVPFRFTNALDIDNKTGDVYFTDSSILFQRREWLHVILTGDTTGRLMKYDPRTNKVSVLLKGLAFPNGVALSDDRSFLVVAESGTFQILRFWLRGSKSRRTAAEVFSPLERSPDNIKKNSKGEFWVALNSGRELQNIGLMESRHETETPIMLGTKDVVAAKYDEEGKIIGVLNGKGGDSLDSVSEVEEHNGYLWIGSAVKPFVGVIRD